MRVAWRGKLSSQRPLPGSGPQGSSWGILEYLSKFMDDLTILDIILLANVGMDSHNTRHQVPSNIIYNNQFIPSSYLKTQTYVQDIDEWTEKNKMKLNEKKTKNMIYFTKDHQFTTEIELKSEKIETL